MKLAVLWLAAALVAAAPAWAERITIVHTNDIHGWMAARDSPQQPGRRIGGAGALGAFYKSVRGPKLLVDAGDWFQGTPEGTLSGGRTMVELFNALGYDAVEVGNHDYDFGEKHLKELVAALKVPALGANVYDAKTGRRVGYLEPHLVKTVGGVKIGLFGLLTTNMRNLAFPENIAGLQFRDEVAEARDQVAALKEEGATVIVALTHVGFQGEGMEPFTSDQVIAAQVPGIDVIVGGHTHTFLHKPYRDPKNGTLVVQDGSYLPTAGEVTLDVDRKTGRVTRSYGRLVDLWVDKWGQDPAVEKIVDAEVGTVAKAFDVRIATAAVELSRNRDGESTLGDWMTDCERAWAGADLAIQNSGGIRADMPQGPVTLRTIFNIMPFDNYVTKLSMDGGLVDDVLDHGVDKSKGMIQVSGAGFAYDRDAAAGRRLSGATIDGAAVDPRHQYNVATIDFLVRGGDGYSPFARAERTEVTRELLRDVLADCARKQGTIVAPPGGRMRDVQEKTQ